MAQVICKLPNASELINGVAFKAVDGGMLSEDISTDQAAAFCAIDGYSLFERKAATVDVDGEAEELARAEAEALAELRARAAGMGIDVDARWAAKRLNAEIAKAEELAAVKAAAGTESKE